MNLIRAVKSESGKMEAGREFKFFEVMGTNVYWPIKWEASQNIFGSPKMMMILGM